MKVFNISKVLRSKKEWKILSFIVILIPSVFITLSFCYFDRNKKNITVRNGEKVDLSEISYKHYSENYTEKIYDFDNFANCAILNALSKENNDVQNLTSYLGYKIDNLGLGYFNYLDNSDLSTFNGGYQLNFNFSQSANFYQTIFNNKSAREFLFYESLNMLKKLCKNNPQDLHSDLLKEMDDLLVFVKQLKSNSNIKLSEYPPYWKGFILRRLKTNKVPISEIEGYLNIAKKELLLIKGQLPAEKSYCDLTVNNEIEIEIGRNTTTLKSKLSTSKLNLKKNEAIKELYYFEDQKNSIYKIVCERIIIDNTQPPYYNENKSETYIFDNKLKLISW